MSRRVRRMGSLLALGLASVALAGGGGAPPQAALTPADCAYPLSAALKTRQVRCLRLQVPEHHARPSGKQLSLFVMVIKSGSRTPRPDPVVYLHGGPGGSVAGVSRWISEQGLQTLGADRDLILFDQRGSGASRPSLTCEDYRSEADRVADFQSGGFNAAALARPTTVRACREVLALAGIDVTAYTSAESAADVEALRRALGVKQVNLYGGSYGTRLALEVLRRFPGSVRSAVLDSPLPAGINYLTGLDVLLDRAIRARLQACADDRLCSETYPNIRERYHALLGRLDRDPLLFDLVGEETGTVYQLPLRSSDLLQVLQRLLYQGGSPSALLGLINALSQGVTGDIGSLLSPFLTHDWNNLTYYAVACPETRGLPGPARPATPPDPHVQAAMQRETAEAEQICAAWPAAGDAALREPVRSDIPTLILTGELDPVTPPEFGRDLKALLPHSQWVNFRWNSHGQGGECSSRLIRAFWQNPSRPVDGSCAASRGEP